MCSDKIRLDDYYDTSDKIDGLCYSWSIIAIMSVVTVVLVGILCVTLTDIVCKATDFVSKVGG